jgi:hypothetical protein
MVRTTGGGEVEATVTVAGSESVSIVELDQTGTIPAGDQETVTLKAPSGSIFEVLGGLLDADLVGSGATGSHRLLVQSETGFITFLEGKSTGDTNLEYQSGHWRTATTQALPQSPGDQTAAIRGIRIDSTSGLNFRYKNNTDGDQTNTRVYRIMVRQIQVSE